MVALKSEKTKTSWGRLGKCVCVCVSALSVNDALHVGNFLVSCIPIGSSRSIRPLPEITPSGQVAFL